MLRALTHIQNLWLSMTEVEVYTGASPRARRRRPETQAPCRAASSSLPTCWANSALMGGLTSKVYLPPRQGLCTFSPWPGSPNGIVVGPCLPMIHTDRSGKSALRYLSWQWRTRAHGGITAGLSGGHPARGHWRIGSAAPRLRQKRGLKKPSIPFWLIGNCRLAISGTQYDAVCDPQCCLNPRDHSRNVSAPHPA